MWARGRTSLDECPTSAIRPESVEWVEKFLMWKLAGGGDLLAMAARDAEAYVTLEKEWREARNGNGQLD